MSLYEFNNQFWEDAFDKGAPFYSSYIKNFRKGIVDENIRFLDMHREAIYYIQDDALIQIISALIHIAAKHSDANFIESLAFFLSSNDQRKRLEDGVLKLDSCSCGYIVSDLDSVCSSLMITSDDDLVDQFLVFRDILKKTEK